MDLWNLAVLAGVVIITLLVAFLLYERKQGVPVTAMNSPSDVAALLKGALTQINAKVGEVASTSTVPPETTMVSRYIDRDDLMKAIGSTGCAQVVIIDGKVVHNGFVPAIQYATNPADGSLSRV